MDEKNGIRAEIFDGFITRFVLPEKFILCQEKGGSVGYFPGPSEELAH